ncbi:MAG TPA: AraC family transcriptional regulator [Puia sp.]
MNNFHKYLAITDLEETWGFYVTTVGYSRIEANQEYPHNQDHPITHSFTWNKGRILNGYYLVFISRGKGTFESALSPSIDIEAGTCFFLFPGIWHRYRPDPSSGWEEYWIGFKGSYPDQLMNKSLFSPSLPVVSPGLSDTLLMQVKKIVEEVRAGSPGYHQVISGITLQILGLVHALSARTQIVEDETLQAVEKAKFYFRENLENPLELKELMRQLPMSYSKFRKIFKEVTGEAPNQYHLNLRLDKARELLSTTNLNVTEVAYSLGFDSVFYFSRLFKNKNGVSPKSYRLKEE